MPYMNRLQSIEQLRAQLHAAKDGEIVMNNAGNVGALDALLMLESIGVTPENVARIRENLLAVRRVLVVECLRRGLPAPHDGDLGPPID